MDPVRCFELVDFQDAQVAFSQDLWRLNEPIPRWQIFHANVEVLEHYPPAVDTVMDHSRYALSIGDCLKCDQDRVFAWVTVSGRLGFRCPDGHENLVNRNGVKFPLWWVPDSEDPSVAEMRYANAGDIAAIIAAGGPRSPDDDELALFDVKWAILPRPAES